MEKRGVSRGEQVVGDLNGGASGAASLLRQRGASLHYSILNKPQLRTPGPGLPPADLAAWPSPPPPGCTARWGALNQDQPRVRPRLQQKPAGCRPTAPALGGSSQESTQPDGPAQRGLSHFTPTRFPVPVALPGPAGFPEDE